MITEKKEPFYNNIERYIIIVLFTAMTTIVAFTVFSRYLFNFTFSWAEQMAKLLLVWTSFAGISWAGRVDAHMRVTALSLLTKKNPKIFDIVFLIGDLIAAAYCFYLAYKIFGTLLMIKSQSQVFSAMPFIPKWVMYLAGVLGMAGMGIRILQRSYISNRDKKKNIGEEATKS